MRDVTLLFLRREGEILLAMKKRGFGEGKWNGVGGKVEVGETIEAATIRECQEEISVTPKILKPAGTLEFYLSEEPDFANLAHIFVTTTWQGRPTETEEMRPQWFSEQAIPFDTMWPDDHIWMPYLLSGTYFEGSFTIGPNDTIVKQRLNLH